MSHATLAASATLANQFRRTVFTLSLAAAGLFSQGASAAITLPPETPVGAVYTQTNATSGNEIAVYSRLADGSLSFAARYPTGGLGSGASLGSQGAVKLSTDGRWLLAVNAGSDELSVFSVDRLGLIATDRVSSGGSHPTSVTIHDNLVYVLNAGSDSVSAFTLDANGKLTPVSDSTQVLLGAGNAPAQVELSPDGKTLVVTEKAASEILVYAVNTDGRLGSPLNLTADTPVPFGFAFGRKGEFFVSEANPGQAGLSTLAAYRLGATGGVKVVNPSAATYQSAACWVVVSHDGHTVYTANPASSSISAFAVGDQGSLSLLNGDGVAATTPSGALDMAVDRSSQHLYSINPASGTLSVFDISSGGGLQGRQTLATNLPQSAYGLAAQ